VKINTGPYGVHQRANDHTYGASQRYGQAPVLSQNNQLVDTISRDRYQGEGQDESHQTVIVLSLQWGNQPRKCCYQSYKKNNRCLI